jgi:hypothetical protein
MHGNSNPFPLTLLQAAWVPMLLFEMHGRTKNHSNVVSEVGKNWIYYRNGRIVVFIVNEVS